VVDDLLRPALGDRHLEGRQDELGAQVGRHRPADDPTAPGVEHHGEVQETAPRRDVGDVGHPELIRAVGPEVPIDEVRRRQLAVAAGRGAHVGAAADAPQAGLAHQTSHPLAGHPVAVLE